MEARVAVLEQIAQDNRETFCEIKTDLREISSSQNAIKVSISNLPSRASLWGMVATVIASAVAIVGVFVGILTYLQK